MDTHQVALAAHIRLQNLVAVGRGFFRRHQGRLDLGGRAQEVGHGAPRQLHGARAAAGEPDVPWN